MIFEALFSWPLAALAWMISQLPAFTAPNFGDALGELGWAVGAAMTVGNIYLPLDIFFAVLLVVVGFGVTVRAVQLGLWIYSKLPVVGK